MLWWRKFNTKKRLSTYVIFEAHIINGESDGAAKVFSEPYKFCVVHEGSCCHQLQPVLYSWRQGQFVSSHGLLLAMISLLPMVLPQSPIKLRAHPENLRLLKVNHTSPPLPGKVLSSPAIHPGSCFSFFMFLSKLPIEPNIRCLLKRIFKEHYGFNYKYIKLLEVNITFLSIIHG